MENRNCYIILGVSRTANSKEIKSAYRLLAKKFHPDKNSGDKTSEEQFKEIQYAYGILSNPEKRKKYDLRSSGKTAKKKTSGRYNGNAYQYAQQQARKQQQAYEPPEEYENSEPYKTELNQILISFIIALILLYFIISF